MQIHKLLRPRVVAISGPGIVGEQISSHKIDTALQRLAAWQSDTPAGDFSRYSGDIPVTWSRGGIVFPKIPIASTAQKRTDFFEPLREAAKLLTDADGITTVFHLNDGILAGVTTRTSAI